MAIPVLRYSPNLVMGCSCCTLNPEFLKKIALVTEIKHRSAILCSVCNIYTQIDKENLLLVFSDKAFDTAPTTCDDSLRG